MAHVEELEHLAVAVSPCSVVPVRDLPPTGDAGLTRQELVASIAELVGLLDGHRSRADHRQVPHEDVQKLRELVDRVLAQEATHARHARIVVKFLLAFPFLELLPCHVELRMRVRVGGHRPELPDIDALAALAHALLAEEWVTRGVQGYGGAEEDARQEARRHDGRREGDVEGALRGAVREAARTRGGDAGIPRRGNEFTPGNRNRLIHLYFKLSFSIVGADIGIRHQLGTERARHRRPDLRRRHRRIALCYFFSSHSQTYVPVSQGPPPELVNSKMRTNSRCNVSLTFC